MLQAPAQVAPWSAPMSAHLLSQLGTDRLSLTAVSFLTAALSPGTYQSYGQKLKKFARFCEQHGKSLTACTTHDILRYVAWLAHEGQVSADSMQPYLSAINKLYQDLGLPAIASGHLVSNTVKGFLGMQKRLVPRALTRSPISAQVIYDMLAPAAFALHSPNLPLLVKLRAARACLATVLAFVFFARPGAHANLLDADLVITSQPQAGIQLLPRGTKGKGRVPAHRLAPLFVPAEVFTAPRCGLAPVDLVALLAEFKQLRDSSFGDKTPVHMWALPGEDSVSFSSQHQTAWLQHALWLASHSPPPGYTWTGHSMRKGAASAASAVGVPLPKICHYGGWSVTSYVVVRDYIDPTYPVTPAALFFFSWLTQGTCATVAVPAP